MDMNLDFSFYNWDLISNFVLKGLYFSLMLTVVATIGGVIFGTVLALMRLSGKKWLEVPATIYVNGMRSIPLVMVILWFFLLVPATFYGIFGSIGRDYRAEMSAVITFIAFEAAYFSEIMRAGIQSIPRGQVFAGQALGMTYGQNMKLVILPQAFRNMLPVLLTQTIILFQDTSLVYAIGAYDMLKGFEVAGKNFGRPLGLRQVHADQDHQRARTLPEGRDHGGRNCTARPQDRPAQAAQPRRHGVPAFRVVPAPVGDGQPDHCADQGAGPQCGRRQEARSEDARTCGPDGAQGQVPRPALGRPAAACGHCARAVDGPHRDAVRRAHLRARPRNGRRSAGRDGGPGQRRHDHDVRDPRNGLCPQGEQPRDLHGRGRQDPGRLLQGRLLQQPRRTPAAYQGLPQQDPAALNGACTPVPQGFGATKKRSPERFFHGAPRAERLLRAG